MIFSSPRTNDQLLHIRANDVCDNGNQSIRFDDLSFPMPNSSLIQLLNFFQIIYDTGFLSHSTGTMNRFLKIELLSLTHNFIDH